MEEEVLSPEDRLDIVGDFKHGSILKVSLIRFLTYEKAVVKPGPRLNMVIGPNGTGKSTILCAICLGLGGEPKILGRASDIETFVMNGHDDGAIELEVCNQRDDLDGGRNPIIRRVIRRDGSPKSAFFWNDQPISGKKVREQCLRDFHVSVDNLCTFLPQEKVGSFSGYDAQQLLVVTEKSLSASQHLYHTHQELIQDQQAMMGGRNQAATLADRLRQLTDENQKLEREKQRMQERQLAVDEAELLRKKLLWTKEQEACKDAVEKKQQQKDTKKIVREEEEKMQPLIDAHKKAEKEKKVCEKEFLKLKKERKKLENELDKQKQKCETHDDNIETVLADIKGMETRRAAKQEKVENLQQKVEQCEKEVEEFPVMQTLREEVAQAKKDHQAIRPTYDESKRKWSQLKQASEDAEREHKHNSDKWKKMQDEKARRRDRIFRQQPNLRKAFEWIRDNRTKFRKAVVGPIVCEVATKSQNAAAYLEQHVANSTLKSFVVQCREDYNLLYDSVRKGLGTPINIIIIKDIPQPKPRLYSQDKLHVLKQEHGILGYLDESFSAPDVVVQALKATSRIDKVLVGTDETQRSLDDRNLLGYLAESEQDGRLLACCVFASAGGQSLKYTSRISKYCGKPSLQVDEVHAAKWLAPGVSADAKQRVKAELDAAAGKWKDLQASEQQTHAEMNDYQEDARQSLDKFKKAQANVKNLEKVTTRLRNAQRKLKEAQEAASVDDEEDKQQKIAELKNRIRNSCKALSAHSESQRMMMVATVQSAGMQLDNEKAAMEETRLRQAKERASRDFRQAEQNFIHADRAFKEAKALVLRLRKEANEQAPLEDENGEELPLQQQLDELKHLETVEDVELALEEANHTVNSIVENRDAIRQYEARKKEMEQVQAELDNLSSSKERRKKELEQKVRPWQTSLENSVSKIDALFSSYMNELGCTGEIALTKGETDDSQELGYFKNWGIEIRVSFREGAKPEVLSARVQSGGERSVSTIMYLMALQDMMVSPFRCVDEINQGLDDRNERLVFRRIVENSTKVPGRGGPTDHAGQYFLITPKLLPNLYDMEVEAMNILFVFNGPYSFKDPEDWDVDRLINIKKRAVTETDAADDEENSENRMIPARAKKSKRGNEEDL